MLTRGPKDVKNAIISMTYFLKGFSWILHIFSLTSVVMLRSCDVVWCNEETTKIYNIVVVVQFVSVYV